MATTKNPPARRTGSSTSTGKLPSLRMTSGRTSASSLQRVDGIPVVTFALDVDLDPDADGAAALEATLEELPDGSSRLLIRGHRSDVANLAGTLTRAVLAEIDHEINGE